GDNDPERVNLFASRQRQNRNRPEAKQGHRDPEQFFPRAHRLGNVLRPAVFATRLPLTARPYRVTNRTCASPRNSEKSLPAKPSKAHGATPVRSCVIAGCPSASARTR